MEYSSGVEGLTFARVDADSQTFQKEMTEDEKKQSEEDEEAGRRAAQGYRQRRISPSNWLPSRMKACPLCLPRRSRAAASAK